MIELAAFVATLAMSAACPECEAAHQRRMNDIAAAPPSGNDSDGEPAAQLATRWGAVATGDGAMGVAEMMESRAQAEDKAMRDCLASAPGATCTVRIAYYNQCVAVSWGDAGSLWARGPDRREVEATSFANCRNATTNCELLYSSCSYAERIG